jgi:hypothetical protein
MRAKEFIIESRGHKIVAKKLAQIQRRDPNWEILQAKRSSGASGEHTDKKRADKMGDVKHKKDKIPTDEAAGIPKRKEDEFHSALDKLVHKTFGHSPDEKKEKKKVKKEGVDRPMPKTDLRVGDHVIADTSKEQYPGGHKSRTGTVTRIGQTGVHIQPDDGGEREYHPYKIVKKSQKVKEETVVSEKAVSKQQQKFMGMVYAAKKGEKPASKEVAKVAAGMSKKAAKDFAKTKHKGLPKKKED